MVFFPTNSDDNTLVNSTTSVMCTREPLGNFNKEQQEAFYSTGEFHQGVVES